MAIEMEHSPTAALDQLQHVVEKPPGGRYNLEVGYADSRWPCSQHPVFTTDYLYLTIPPKSATRRASRFAAPVRALSVLLF